MPAAALQGEAASSTRLRLLEAAEAVIAAQGIDKASVRAINAAAGTNVAAVHYHFGSKEALVDAVLARRMDELTRRRTELVDELATQTRSEVRAVVLALVLPIAESAAEADSPGRRYVRFLAALDAAGPPWRARIDQAFSPQYGRWAEALGRVLPDASSAVLAFRLSLARTEILSVLADPELYCQAWSREGISISPRGIVDSLIDHIAGALGAPATPNTEGGNP